MTCDDRDDGPGRPMRRFGPRVSERLPETPTPVGAECGPCKEPILPGDSGVVMDRMSAEGLEDSPHHLECFFWTIMATEEDHESGKSVRDQARSVLARVSARNAAERERRRALGYRAYLEKRDCRGCGTAPGALHDPGCGLEQCPACGFQAVGCEHAEELLREGGRLGKDRLPWAGFMSMTEEAAEYGFFVRWVDGDPHGRWIQCDEDDPDAMPSRNHVAERCRWDPGKKKFMRREA